MRVHGSEIIRRRKEIEPRQYAEYLPELREDFHYLCGYCGKSESVTKKGFETDHFVPLRIAPELENTYGNLVYSCFTCNRKKGRKWPTENPKKNNDGAVGFVDPASDEFDTNVARSDDGKIVGCTSVGRYMCKNVFKFHRRPIDTVWKAMQIVELKRQLRQKLDRLSDQEKMEYIRIDEELEKLMQYLFDKRE